MLPRIAGLAVIPVLLSLAGVSFAAETKAGHDMAKKKITQMTCEDFNGISESFKPSVIAWAEGFRQGAKKPDDVTIDVAGIEKVTPFVVEACKKEPKASFWSKAKAELKKVF